MFPFWKGAISRHSEAIDTLAQKPYFRIGVAALVVIAHLAAFTVAGRQRLDVPFNYAPGEPPYFSNPDAPEIGGFWPRQPHHWSRLVVSRWDAEHYISFALRGMTACPENGTVPGDPIYTDQKWLECGLAWFPAWGMIAGEIAWPLDLPVDYVLLFMSIVCTMITCLIWTSKPICDRIGRSTAYLSLLALNLYPSAFYQVAPYTEAATLALVLGGLVCMLEESWIPAGILVGAATGLRAGAIAFIPAFGIAALAAFWRRRRSGAPDWWKPLVGGALAPWGLAAQFAAFQIALGDWRAYLRAREIFGDDRDYGRLIDPEYYLKGFTAQHMDAVMLIGGIAIVALCGREVVKRFKLEASLFLCVSAFIGAALSMAAVHEYWGLNRYLLMCPILFFSAGVMARKHTAVFVLWLLLCAAIYWHVELCSYLAHGDPRVCPCLGRVEFTFPWGS